MPVLRRAALRSVKLLAAGADRLRTPAAGVVILIYHRVGGGSDLEVDLPVELFEEQMAALADSHRVVPLGVALEELESPAAPAGDLPVAVTFDDGTADFADTAVPVLVRHGVPATLYVATAFVDEGRPFWDGARPVSWAGLADACTTGLVEVGSHTHRHLLLDRFTGDEVATDLDRSIGLIGDHLGRQALDFAYPRGVDGSAQTAREVRTRFRSAALGGTRANRYGATDPHRLARSPIQVSDGMTWFRRKLAGGLALEDVLRRRLNRFRYAGSKS